MKSAWLLLAVTTVMATSQAAPSQALNPRLLVGFSTTNSAVGSFSKNAKSVMSEIPFQVPPNCQWR
jgi:hypothetical protein